MIKVMVVEDEPPILRSICNAIESVNQEFKVTAMADNGSDAIKLLETDVPDVLFTDIQMSVIDGLALIRHIREKNLDMEIAILSGYSEFSYARSAMSLGVDNYLLKPLNKEELSGLLEKLASKVNHKNNKLKIDFFSSILGNRSIAPDKRPELVNSGHLLLMLFCAGSFPTYSIDYYSPRKAFWENTDLEKLISGSLLANESCFAFEGATGVERVAILTLQEPSRERADYITASVFNELKCSTGYINICVSPYTEDLENIGAMLKELRTRLNKEMVFAGSRIFRPGTTAFKGDSIKTEFPFIDVVHERRLKKCAESGSISSLKNELLYLFRQWESAGYLQVWVEKLVKDIAFICANSLEIHNAVNFTDLDFQINQAISDSGSYQDLFRNVWYIFQELFDLKLKNSDAGASIDLILKKIDAYIAANYAEPINNQVLSEKFGLVPSYLSKLYYNYKGMSPTDYLFHLRVEKAKELMRTQPDILTKDISAITGFCDPFHFSKVFKRKTGMSPSEYKNSIAG